MRWKQPKLPTSKGNWWYSLSTDYPPDHGTAQQDRKNNRVERILIMIVRERDK